MTVLSQGPPFYTQREKKGCPERDIKKVPPPEGRGSVMPADQSEGVAVLRVILTFISAALTYN